MFCSALRDYPAMTKVLHQKGQLVLPVPVRQRLHLSFGDAFEIAIEDEDTITLRRVCDLANHGLWTCCLPVHRHLRFRRAKQRTRSRIVSDLCLASASDSFHRQEEFTPPQ